MKRMKLLVTEKPDGFPVSLDLVKQHCRIDYEFIDEDDYLNSVVIPAAVNFCEGYMQRALLPREYEQVFDGFPCGKEPIKLVYPPILEIVSVSYYDSAGASASLTGFQSDLRSEPCLLYPAVGETWPQTQCERIDAVTVTYRAGYELTDEEASEDDAPSPVPADIIKAILLVCGHFNENREILVAGNMSTESPLAARALMDPYRVYA